jgi:protein disulfide-isomerase A1
MKSLLCLVSALVTLVSAGSTNKAKIDNGVIVLTDDNFDTVVENNKYLFVMFYAPWCGHCKRFAPLYSSAAKKLAEKEPARNLAKIDAEANKKTAERFKI